MNCKYVDKTVEITVLGDKYELSIPTLVRIAPIAKDDEIIVLKESSEQDEPTSKRKAEPPARTAAAKKRTKK